MANPAAKPQKPDTGAMGFRTYDDPPDERPLLRYRQFWRDDAERTAYLKAVRAAPCKDYGSLDLFDYLHELAKLATGLDQSEVVKEFPR